MGRKVYQQRVRGVGSALVTVAAAFDDHKEIVLSREGASATTGPRTVPVRSSIAGGKAQECSRPPRPSGVLRAGTARAGGSLTIRPSREIHRRNHIFVGDYSSAIRAIVLLHSPVIGSDQARLAPASRLSNAALKTGSESASTRVGLP